MTFALNVTVDLASVSPWTMTQPPPRSSQMPLEQIQIQNRGPPPRTVTSTHFALNVENTLVKTFVCHGTHHRHALTPPPLLKLIFLNVLDGRLNRKCLVLPPRSSQILKIGLSLQNRQQFRI